MAIFMNDDSYRSLVDALARAFTEMEPGVLVRALANAEPCAITGAITKDGIIEALGEIADVWPEAIRDHVESESANVIQFPDPALS
jgi:hypothetical protein